MFEARMNILRERLRDGGIDLAFITDDDSVYYFTGYYDYLHMEFGRPTILAVFADGPSHLVTPAMEKAMADATAKVDHISYWRDGVGQQWGEALSLLAGKARRIAIEPLRMPAVVRNFLDEHGVTDPKTVSPIIENMRMIKSEEELALARHAGLVASTMMDAARATIGDGVPEFEVALAASAAGTRKAAELLRTHYGDGRMSPNTHFLQIMASGPEIAKPHHRASTRIMRRGEPVFMCFCGMTNFHRFKLGFDRTFWIGDIRDDAQARVYETALESQKAALSVLRPGVRAEDVHAAYAEVIRSAGHEFPFRCGRATGFSFLEKPELVSGDRTILKPGMVFAVDGSVTLDARFRAQVGDSFSLTSDGYEQLTFHPNALNDVIIT